MIMKTKACIFDLDGVVVDTAKYHYLAWKKLAKKLGFDFNESDNESLKGISRMQSLEILLEIGGISIVQAQKEEYAEEKNNWYKEFLAGITHEDMIAGAEEFLTEVKARKIPTALASASKNANMVLEKLNISKYFDAVVDVSKIKRIKPDPELFLTAANMVGVESQYCCVFEDAQAGIDGALAAGMKVIGIGDPSVLKGADIVIPDFTNFKFDLLP